jgi:hypothetical protein
MLKNNEYDTKTRPGGVVTSNDERLPEKIKNLNLGPIIWKITDKEEGVCEVDWTPSQALRVSEEYRKFLALTTEGGEQINTAPSRNVDVMWHYHILDTAKYYHDMHEIFGHIVHHFPYLGVRGSDDQRILLAAYEDTLKRYEVRFGKPPEDVWGQAARCGVSSCSSISNCTTS